MYYNKSLFLSLVSGLLFFNITYSQPDNEYYLGDIDVVENQIKVILEIKNKQSVPEIYMYIFEQFVYAMKSDEVFFKDSDTIYARFRKISGNFSLKFNKADNNYKGKWTQGNQNFNASFSQVESYEVAYLQRPQTPHEPFDYVIKEYEIENLKAGVKLSGTLTLPKENSEKKYPLVILVTGSGPQDRNEEIAGHKPFLIIADYLTKNGIAVFCYDDRGVGKSTGNFSNSTSLDFMLDAVSILKFFQNHPKIDKNLIGIAGHSEGGLIAIMAAAKYPKDVKFIISLAGPAVPMKELLAKQAVEIYKKEGYPAEDIILLSKMQKELFKHALKAKDIAELRKLVTNTYNKYRDYFSEDKLSKYKINNQGINLSVVQLSGTWMRYFLSIDPTKYIKKISCPVLILNGEKDLQVDADLNIQAFSKLLNPNKCKIIQIHKLSGLNHLFQNCDKCTINEYFYIQESISPQVLSLMKEFVFEVQKIKRK